MKQSVNFCGATGKAWSFTEVDADDAWARVPGIAIFAAPDSYGWRVIKVVELTGREHDVRPLWALADAERYGAETVFVSLELTADVRQWMMADLEDGLSPVIHSNSGNLAMAA